MKASSNWRGHYRRIEYSIVKGRIGVRSSTGNNRMTRRLKKSPKPAAFLPHRLLLLCSALALYNKRFIRSFISRLLRIDTELDYYSTAM